VPKDESIMPAFARDGSVMRMRDYSMIQQLDVTQLTLW